MHARLILEAGDCVPTALDLTPAQTATIGRGRDSTLVVRSDLVSRLHAKVYHEAGQWVVRDFGLNGVRVDGHKITGAAVLADGAVIQLADVQFRFITGVAAATPTPVPGRLPAPAGSAAPAPVHRTPLGRPADAVGTKVHDFVFRQPILDADPEADDGPVVELDPADPHLKVDELTALCQYMTAAVHQPDPYELISETLCTILNQTSATLAGYLSLDPADPMPKVVLPERTPVDARLSRRLTERVRRTGKLAWLAGDDPGTDPGESLHSFTDAVCLPLTTQAGEAFAAVHLYRTGRHFTDRDVRFLEVAARFLAPTLEILRTRRKLEAENSRLRSTAPVADELIGDSSSVMNLRVQISRAAPQPFTVLIHGESGSGKELVAQALHRHSQRSDGPLVVLNCAAIAPTLLEAELFGYRKGAFSGADRDHPGLFEQADEGTLFLDEVGELSLECQAKLLRVIEGKAFRPVGGTKDLKVDVRLVAATHRDLEVEARAGRFRQDLLFRLKVITLRVPPLRDHAEDTPELARFFLERLSVQCRRAFRLTPAALRKLQAYPWPGNVRQLRAVLESAAVMSEADLIDADGLPLGPPEPPLRAADAPPSLDVDSLETWAIRKALLQTGGNVSQAAKLLGMSRDTLHTKLKKKGIDRESVLQVAAGE